MPKSVSRASFLIAAALSVLNVPVAGATDSQHSHPPAGQVCPQGSYVIGFDASGNILCSGTCGNRVLDSGEACDDGNTVSGDGCPADCGSPDAEAAPGAVAASPKAAPPASTPPAAAAAAPVIDDIEPSSAVYGAREITLTITGTGFTSATTVLFQGEVYRGSVNLAGTELTVTLGTRGLAIGRYPLTVSNGPGLKTTVRRGLEIF